MNRFIRYCIPFSTPHPTGRSLQISVLAFAFSIYGELLGWLPKGPVIMDNSGCIGLCFLPNQVYLFQILPFVVQMFSFMFAGIITTPLTVLFIPLIQPLGISIDFMSGIFYGVGTISTIVLPLVLPTFAINLFFGISFQETNSRMRRKKK